VTAAVENPQPFPTEQVVGQAILGGSRFVKKVIKEIGKDRGLREASGRWLYKGGIDLEDLKKTVSKFYGIKGIKGNMTGMSEEQKRGREMFIYLAKEETTALNRAIAEVVGMTSGSGVTHCYKRIANQLKKDERQLREWKREAGAILSRFKG